MVAEAGFEPLKLRPLAYETSEHSELLYSAVVVEGIEPTPYRYERYWQTMKPYHVG